MVFLHKKTLGRILAIDYGTKRVGIAVTDSLKIIANGLTTVHSKDLIDFLKDYFAKESVEQVVIGYPRQMDCSPSEAAKHVDIFYRKFLKEFPDMPIQKVDERFTSKMATAAILESGAKKKDRQNKALVDTVSAAIILQSYMEELSFKNQRLNQ